MENPLKGEVHVHDLGQLLFYEGEEYPLRGLAHVAVLHRGLADYRGRVYGVLPHRHTGQVEHRELVREAIVPGMVPEGAFYPPLFGLAIALKDDLGVRGDLYVRGLALDHLYRALAEETGQEHFVYVRRHRGRGGIHHCRVRAYRYGHG